MIRCFINIGILILVGYAYIFIRNFFNDKTMVGFMTHLQSVWFHVIELLNALFGKYTIGSAHVSKRSYYMPPKTTILQAVESVHEQMKSEGWIRTSFNSELRGWRDFSTKFMIELKVRLWKDNLTRNAVDGRPKPVNVNIATAPVAYMTVSNYYVVVDSDSGRLFFCPLPEKKYLEPVRLLRKEIHALTFIQ